MRWAIAIAFGFVGVMAWPGCREQPPQYANERELGDADERGRGGKSGVLMPVNVGPADKRILEDQTGVKEETFGGGRRIEGAAKGEAQPADEGKPGRGGGAAGRGAAGRRGGAEPAAAEGLAGLAEKIQKEKEGKGATPGQTPEAKGPAESKPATAPAGKTPSVGSGSSTRPASPRMIDNLSFQMSAPWQPWKPPMTDSLIAGYTRKGIADVAAWGFDLPKHIKPDVANTPGGAMIVAAVVQAEAKKRFALLDKWAGAPQTSSVDGVQVIEARASLKKGPVAGGQDTAEAVCFGIVGKNRGFLVAYRVPATNKNADDVRKAILSAMKMK
jgi:hypothetical protein